jgi:hypothetical protein
VQLHGHPGQRFAGLEQARGGETLVELVGDELVGDRPDAHQFERSHPGADLELGGAVAERRDRLRHRALRRERAERRGVLARGQVDARVAQQHLARRRRVDLHRHAIVLRAASGPPLAICPKAIWTAEGLTRPLTEPSERPARNTFGSPSALVATKAAIPVELRSPPGGPGD